eukprot:3687970-Amphidinium_carterae.1
MNLTTNEMINAHRSPPNCELHNRCFGAADMCCALVLCAGKVSTLLGHERELAEPFCQPIQQGWYAVELLRFLVVSQSLPPRATDHDRRTHRDLLKWKRLYGMLLCEAAGKDCCSSGHCGHNHA